MNCTCQVPRSASSKVKKWKECDHDQLERDTGPCWWWLESKKSFPAYGWGTSKHGLRLAQLGPYARNWPWLRIEYLKKYLVQPCSTHLHPLQLEFLTFLQCFRETRGAMWSCSQIFEPHGEESRVVWWEPDELGSLDAGLDPTFRLKSGSTFANVTHHALKCPCILRKLLENLWKHALDQWRAINWCFEFCYSQGHQSIGQKLCH